MRILVVDDEYSELILARLAERNRIRIDVAKTRKQGASQAVSEPTPDLILMDGYLDEDHDSLFLVKLIRRNGYAGPMVAISSDDKMQAKLLEAGCSEAWAKSDIPERLERWVREHLPTVLVADPLAYFKVGEVIIGMGITIRITELLPGCNGLTVQVDEATGFFADAQHLQGSCFRKGQVIKLAYRGEHRNFGGSPVYAWVPLDSPGQNFPWFTLSVDPKGSKNWEHYR